MRLWAALLLLAALAACTSGSSTTRRPALTRPAIGPEGTLWDALDLARRDQPARLKNLFSMRFLHEQVLPDGTRGQPANQDEYLLERAILEGELAPYGARIDDLCRRYARQLRQLSADCFIEAGDAKLSIKHRDEFGAALGPNTARMTVFFHPVEARTGPDGKPTNVRTITVVFVQEFEQWKIDGLEPDPLKGAFHR
jgi:hypothetical protein